MKWSDASLKQCVKLERRERLAADERIEQHPFRLHDLFSAQSHDGLGVFLAPAAKNWSCCLAGTFVRST